MKIGDQVYVYRKMTSDEKMLDPNFYEVDFDLYKIRYITLIINDSAFVSYRLNINKKHNEFGSGYYYPEFVLKSVRKMKFKRIID